MKDVIIDKDKIWNECKIANIKNPYLSISGLYSYRIMAIMEKYLKENYRIKEICLK